MLSVILPVRCGPANEYLLDRLEANLALLTAHPEVECVVVDSASPAPYADRIRRVATRERCRVIADPAPQQPFAPGLTRDAGALHTAGELLLFYDVDLCCGDGFIDLLLDTLGRRPAWNDFVIIPSLFLTRAATERIRFTGRPIDLQFALDSLLVGDNDVVNNVAFTHLATTRELFLRIGGNRPDYRGHGCEDFDLLHRLASYRPLGRRPADYYADVRTRFPGDYVGFRAYLARYALPHLFEGLYTAHLWHERPIRRRYFRRRRSNEALLQQRMREHDRGDVLAPLAAREPLPAPWRDEGTGEPPPWRDTIATLMTRHGLSADRYPGLFRWRADVAPPRGTTTARLRKLIMRPREFFADSRLPYGLPRAAPRDRLHIAAVLDEFSRACFEPEAELIHLHARRWRLQLATRRPDLLLVESAWRGVDDSWKGRIATYPGRPDDTLARVVEHCRKRDIPTVFWNKEDPVHFERFISVARRFNVIFTTDADCVADYHACCDLAPGRVRPLMFAAQPTLHFPGPAPRDDVVCFAGSYGEPRFPERRRQLEALLDAAAEHQLIIYDRFVGAMPDRVYPARFARHLRPALSYRTLAGEYRRHKVFLNVNSVADSPTMFARRVFELLACGTCVVSSPSVGMQSLFGDVVAVADDRDSARAALDRILTDDDYRAAIAARGIELVRADHTYAHRLREIAATVGLRAKPAARGRADRARVR